MNPLAEDIIRSLARRYEKPRRRRWRRWATIAAIGVAIAGDVALFVPRAQLVMRWKTRGQDDIVEVVPMRFGGCLFAKLTLDGNRYAIGPGLDVSLSCERTR